MSKYCCDNEHEHREHGKGCESSCSCGCGCGTVSRHSGRSETIRQGFVIGISLVSLIFSFLNPAQRWGIEFFHYVNPAWICLILCGWPIVHSAWQGITVGRKVTSNLLISIAMFAAVALEIFTLTNLYSSGSGHQESYIFAAGEIAFLMALGELIEEWTVKRSRAGIEALVKLSPTTANVKREGTLVELPVTELSVGDIVVTRPGEMIPVDGEIVSGKTAVDQSTMTGESIPVDKEEGDAVFGGTWNKSGAIEVRMTKPAKDMAVNRLIDLVEEAEGKRAPISRLADRWASYIIPSAIILSILVALAAYFLLDTSVLSAVIRGVTILVVFCPCALALATPTAVAAGLGNAARRGALVKNGAALETMAKVDALALDKTGTLTQGQIEVDGIQAFGMTENELLQLAGSAEKYSEHPIAKAIVNFAAERTLLPDAAQTTSLIGIGVKAKVDGRDVLVCQWAYLQNLQIDISSAAPQASLWLEQGRTVTAVCADGVLYGIISLSDTLRKGAPGAMKAVHDMGITTAMLTGDNGQAAKKIARAAGIDTVSHSLMPDEKLVKLREIQKAGKTVCMVGDGVNDAPGLAAADCSIAMGALGSDIAIETADIALMTSDIRRLPGLFALSRRVLATIKINIALSLTINIIAVILSTFGALTPVTGALVHNAASILVVLNSSLILASRDRFYQHNL